MQNPSDDKQGESSAPIDARCLRIIAAGLIGVGMPDTADQLRAIAERLEAAPLVDIRRSIMARNEKIVRPILKMLREAHKAIEQEINATGDYAHPVIKRKLEMLDRHRRSLEKMGLA